MLQTLSDNELRRMAPSVFATEPWDKVSDKYAFISTYDIVQRLREEGLNPVKARQSRTRIEGKQAFTRHELRFVSSEVESMVVGGTYPTVMLTNSHDLGSSFAIDAGMFRLACSNGMMVPNGIAQSARVKHIGDVSDVIEGVFQVVDELKVIPDLIREYSAIQLKPQQQIAFAEAAAELRESSLPLRPDQLLHIRRQSDTGTDLWSTLNVVQENITKGGLNSRSATGRRMRTRAIADIGADQKLNRALFVLAEKMKGML